MNRNSLFSQGLGRDQRVSVEDWEENVEQGMVWSSTLRDRGHFMFELGTHSTKVFKEDILGSVVQEARRDRRRQQQFRAQ